MKSLHFSLLYYRVALFCWLLSLVHLLPAQEINHLFADTLRSRALPASFSVRNQRLIDAAGAEIPDARRTTRILKSWCTVTLETNPLVETPAARTFYVRLSGTLHYRNAAGSGSAPLQLEINYRPEGGSTYKHKDVQVLHDLWWAEIRVETLETDLPAGVRDDYFTVHAACFAEQYGWMPRVAPEPAAPRIEPTVNRANLTIHWDEPDGGWAKYYDLEWTFVDLHSDRVRITATGRVTNYDFSADFRQNAGRVRITTNRYEIPLVYEPGFIVCRVRAIGVGGVGMDKLLPGSWSCPEQPVLAVTERGGELVIPTHVFFIREADAHEAGSKNWQYIAGFSDEGKRKDVVTYYDGSLRARQAVTRLNSEEDAKVLLIGETIYDHQGRPGVQMLPAPFKPYEGARIAANVRLEHWDIPDLAWPSDLPPPLYYAPSRERWRTESPALRYQPAFNTNTDGQPYSRGDFDLDIPDPKMGDAACPAVQPARSAGNISGAANYYSPSNPARGERFNAYLPDAGGFPFLETEYMPDNTGRVKRQGGPGSQHQLGEGHTVKISYENPSQGELDRMFGNNAGNYLRYQKEVVEDENGQIHLTYRNPAGQVVATALAGAAPGNLDALPDIESRPVRRAWTQTDNLRMEEEGVLLQAHSIVITQNRTPVSFDYRLEPHAFRDDVCGEILCYDCQYDLEWEIRRECGEVLHSRRIRVGTLEQIQTCQEDNGFADRFETVLDAGTYYLTKRLTVNAESITAYTDDFVDRAGCLTTIADIPPPLCVEERDECVPCLYDLVVLPIYDKEVRVFIRREGNDPNCSRACAGSQLYDVFGFETLLADMSPRGQYANFDAPEDSEVAVADAFPFSIFNAHNKLGVANTFLTPSQTHFWQYPLYDYRDPDGSIAWVEVTDLSTESYDDSLLRIDPVSGRRWVKPSAILDIALLARLWKDSWTEALVPLHPEYAYYEWKRDHRTSYDYDEAMRQTATYAAATAAGYLDATEDPDGLTAIVERDPFFRENPSANLLMMENLRRFLEGVPATAGTPARAAKNIYEAVHITLSCSAPGYARVSDEVLNECIARHHFSALSAAQRDEAWTTYRAFYLSAKEKIVDRFRQSALEAGPETYFGGRRTNNCIGEQECPPCGLRGDSPEREALSGKMRRYPVAFCMEDGHLPVDTDGDGEIDHWHATQREIVTLAAARQRLNCNVCPVLNDFLSVLAIRAMRGGLDASADEMLITESLVSEFSDPMSLGFSWHTAPDGDLLTVRILSVSGEEQTRIELRKDRSEIPWNIFRFFGCPRDIRESSFTMTGYDNNGGRRAQITVFASRIKFTGCPLPGITALRTPHAATYLDLFRFLFRDGAYRSAVEIPQNLRFAPGITTWRRPTSLTDSRINGSFAGGKEIYTVSIWHLSKGVSFRDIAEIRAIEPRLLADGRPNPYSFILKARTATGIDVDIFAESKFWPAAFQPFRPGGSQQDWYCCVRPSPPAEQDVTCTSRGAIMAISNAANAHLARITEVRDSVRRVLMRHCMDAAERMAAEYNQPVYQYTLFFYDMAGNLVQTAPPAGVRLLSDAEVSEVQAYRYGGGAGPVLPRHQMVTTYRFNTLNETVFKNTPDGQGTRYCYDELGRVILSQDAVQAANGQASYLIYDALGRIQESGLTDLPAGDYLSQNKRPYRQYLSDVAQHTALAKTEISRTCYDAPCNPDIQPVFAGGQQHLRNRIASVSFSASGGTDFDYATHFSYDLLGNVREMAQENAKLRRDFAANADVAAQAVKSIRYRYDLLSGSVTQSVYQPGKADQFIHWYAYDADNRVRRVYTAQSEYLLPGGGADLEARYHYYWHGPLARLELGADKVQGIDYAYTLQGWLKGINSVTGDPALDMGKDGRNAFAPDVYGYALSYFESDYQPIGVSSDALEANRPFLPEMLGSAVEAAAPGLFNGNIRYALSRIAHPVSANVYRYDQLGRLKQSTFYRPESDGRWATLPAPPGGLPLPPLSTDYDYDRNGNITRLRRTSATALFDDLTYRYPLGNNRLRQIQDAGVGLPDAADLPNQPDFNNYRYDDKGRLISDRSEGNLQLRWTNADQLKSQNRDGRAIQFEYDALGRRALKKTDPQHATMYVRDAAGNTLSEYEIRDGQVFWLDVPLYAGRRLGLFQPNQPLTASGMGREDGRIAVFRGQKRYELANHTGDVLAVVSDRRVPDDHATPRRWIADIRSAQDYYPFGMPMPGRGMSGSEAYRYGFQGMEREDDIKGAGNAYTTEFRQYDVRVGRWMSVDPMSDNSIHLSPYNSNYSDPINNTDILGAQAAPVISRATRFVLDRGIRYMERLISRNSTLQRHMTEHFGRQFISRSTRQALVDGAVHTLFRRSINAPRLIIQAMVNPSRIATQGSRTVIESGFERTIGQGGERILRVVLSASGRVITAYPIESYTLTIAAMLIAESIDDNVVQAQDMIEGVAERYDQLIAAREAEEESFTGFLSRLLEDPSAVGGWSEQRTIEIDNLIFFEIIPRTILDAEEALGRSLNVEERREIATRMRLAIYGQIYQNSSSQEEARE